MNLFLRLWRDETGQDLVEYSLVLAAITLFAAAIFIDMPYVRQIWENNAALLSSASEKGY